jgi:hypothetical protein
VSFRVILKGNKYTFHGIVPPIYALVFRVVSSLKVHFVVKYRKSEIIVIVINEYLV